MHRFSQLRGSSDDGKSKLKLHFQDSETKVIETKVCIYKYLKYLATRNKRYSVASYISLLAVLEFLQYLQCTVTDLLHFNDVMCLMIFRKISRFILMSLNGDFF